MSFKSKIDFCGLANGTTILLKSHAEGRANTIVTCENDEGDTVDVTKVGQVMDPSNDYALKGDLTNFEIVLGKVNTVNLGTTQAPDNHYFVLKEVSIGTSNSGEVSISAQAEEVASADEDRTYTITIASLKCRNKAQVLNGLFSMSGTNVHLQSASYTFSVNVNHTTVDGARVTFDVYGGSIVAAVEAKQAGSTPPTITPGSDGVTVVTNDPDESRPDSDYATVSAEITKYLTADPET